MRLVAEAGREDMEKGVVSLTFLGPQTPLAPPPLGASLPQGQCLPFSWLCSFPWLPQSSPIETELKHLFQGRDPFLMNLVQL